MFALAITGAVVTLIIIAFKPKLGTYLIWTILFTYPNSWWAYHQFLPLNIGVDDLFSLFLFASVLLRRNLLGGVRIRYGYAFWAITAFTVILMVANLAGMTGNNMFGYTAYEKDILKQFVYWGLFFAILHSIDTEQDLKMQFTMFAVASVLGATIVILQYFLPYQMAIFSAPVILEKVGSNYGERAGGAFMNANSAACVLAASLMIVLAASRVQRRITNKLLVYSFIFILLAGIVVTRSRSGLMALAGGIGLMAITGKNKKYAWLLIVAVIIVGGYLSGIRELYQERLKEIYDPTTGAWTGNVAGRFDTWASYFSTAGFKDYLLGQGFIQGVTKNGMESHSMYVSLITVYGIGGTIWAIIVVVIFFRKYLKIKNAASPYVPIIANGCLWGLVVIGIYGFASDAISQQFARYIIFFVIVMLDRAHFISKQEELWIVPEEQIEFSELPDSQVQNYG